MGTNAALPVRMSVRFGGVSEKGAGFERFVLRELTESGTSLVICRNPALL